MEKKKFFLIHCVQRAAGRYWRTRHTYTRVIPDVPMTIIIIIPEIIIEFTLSLCRRRRRHTRITPPTARGDCGAQPMAAVGIRRVPLMAPPPRAETAAVAMVTPYRCRACERGSRRFLAPSFFRLPTPCPGSPSCNHSFPSTHTPRRPVFCVNAAADGIFRLIRHVHRTNRVKVSYTVAGI